MHISFFNGKTENIYQIIHKRFLAKLLKTAFFSLINLEVTSAAVFPLTTTDFILLHWFLSKSIMLFILLFLNASNFVSTSLVSFLFFDFFSFRPFPELGECQDLRYIDFFMEFIFSDLNGSSFLTFAICCWKSCAICCSNASLFTKLETSLSKRL